MSYTPSSEKLKKFFDNLAVKREYWIKKNYYYYQQVYRLHQWFIPSGNSVLDIGCGTGKLLAAVKPSTGLGIDASFEMVKIATKKHPRFSFKVMDAHSLSLKQTYDYIILSNLVGYLEDIWQVMRELKKVCHGRTRIVITNYNYLWQPVISLAEKMKLKMPDLVQNWLPQDSIEHFLYLNGFEVIKSGKYLHIPVNIPYVSNITNNILANIPLINRLGLIEYIVARPVFCEERAFAVSVSIVVPTFQEAGNIKNIVERMPQIGKKTELIFVDLPGSDTTGDIIKETIKKYKGNLHIKYVRQSQKSGKAGAIRLGVGRATGQIIIIYDADMTVPPEDLQKVYLALLEKKADFVNGTRMVYPTERGAMRFLNLLGNTTFAHLFTWALGQHFTDTLCGTKGFWREDFMDFEKTKSCFYDYDFFGDFYLILSAYRKNLRIAEVPVRYKTRRYGDTKMNRFKNGIRFLVTFLHFFWFYKILHRVD